MKGKANVLSEVNIFMTIYNLTRCINIMGMDELKRRLRDFLPLVSLYMSLLLIKNEMQKKNFILQFKYVIQIHNSWINIKEKCEFKRSTSLLKVVFAQTPDKVHIVDLKTLLVQTLYIRKIVLKVEHTTPMAWARELLLCIQRKMLEDDRYRSLIVYYDVEPL